MKEIVRDSLKTGLLFGLIGTIVALSVPPLLTLIVGATAAGALGASTATGVLHTALVFGVFGLLDPVLKPVLGFIFGDKKDTNASLAQEKSEAKQVNITIVKSPQQSQAQGIVDIDTKHQKKLQAERIVALLTGDNNRTPTP